MLRNFLNLAEGMVVGYEVVAYAATHSPAYCNAGIVIAACVLLFSLVKLDCTPKDVSAR